MLAVEASKIAFTYLRISSDRDGDELGVERQRVALGELIEQRGWVHGREFVDNDQSAFKGRRREGYVALLEAVRTGECDVLVCSEMSRLTRHPRELEDLVDLIEATKVQVTALRAGHIDLSTSGGRVTARILGAMARMESEQMAERIRSKKAEGTKAGRWSGGPRPYGYDNIDRRLVVKPDEADRIKGWVRDVLAGRTVSSIVTELNNENVPTVRGGRWTGPTVNQVLRSPRIIGMTGSGGEPVADAQWDALIDRADWEAVAGVLDGRRRGPTPRTSLLAGLVFCGLCGARMPGAARGERARQYVCSKAVTGGCGRMGVAAARLDEYVTGLVMGAADRANLGLVRAERHVRDSERLIREVAEDEALLADLATDVGERRISRAEWINARGPAEKRLHVNRAALKALGHGGNQLPDDLVALDDGKWAALTFDQQRAVIGLFVDRIVINPIGNKAGKVFRPERVAVLWK